MTLPKVALQSALSRGNPFLSTLGVTNVRKVGRVVGLLDGARGD